jgi:hypothetical protein
MQQAYGHALAAGGVPLRMGVVGTGGATVSAGIGRAAVVGLLSVPPGWVSAAPVIRTVAAVLPQASLGAVPAAIAADGEGSLFGNMALSGLAGRALAGTGGTVARSVGADALSGAAATTATIIVIPED